MDPSSQIAIAFLSQAQHSMSRLRELSQRLSAQGAKPDPPTISLSVSNFILRAGSSKRKFDGCLALVLPVTSAEGKDYELGVDLLWDKTGWTLLTEVSVEGVGGWAVLHAWPERHTDELEVALDHLQVAVENLCGAASLVGNNAPSSA